MTPDLLPAVRTADFDYPLPPDLIAQFPAATRDASRLLVVHRDRPGPTGLEDRSFPDLVSLPSPGDLLVRNVTRVWPARFLGTRAGGGAAEVLLIHPASTAGSWIALGKPGRALRPGRRIRVAPDLEIVVEEVLPGGERQVRFEGLSADEAMTRHGLLPLPPYISRAPEAVDRERYQTVYAEAPGSVAAPTAGLHFTPALFEALIARGVEIGNLTLDVGPGTFRPVEAEDPAHHPMHPERYDIPATLVAQVRAVRARGGRVWAIGTTVVRALEAAAQDDGTLATGPAETRLLITPGFRFRVVDRLVTNFHLPRSTLLMLVAALADTERILEAYRHAVRHRYRFYSYGDAMVIL